MQYWLLKTEPTTFSIYDFMKLPNQVTHWEGIRNYQARNNIRSMKVCDKVFIYHSVKDPVGIFGIGEIIKEAYPDFFQFNLDSKYYDPKASDQKVIWDMVDVKLIEIFEKPLLLKDLKTYDELSEMALVQKGSRLSIQPVTKKDWDFILNTSSTCKNF